MRNLGISVIAALLVAGTLVIAGCSADSTGTNSGGFGPGVGGGGGGGGTPPPPPVPPPPVTGAPTLVLTLANPATGAATTSAPATARAIVRDATGAAVPSVVVTFTVDNTNLAALVPPSGTEFVLSTVN